MICVFCKRLECHSVLGVPKDSYDHILTILVLRSYICDYTAMQYECFLYYRRSYVEQVTLYLEIATGVGGAVPLPMCGRQLLA